MALFRNDCAKQATWRLRCHGLDETRRAQRGGGDSGSVKADGWSPAYKKSPANPSALAPKIQMAVLTVCASQKNRPGPSFALRRPLRIQTPSKKERKGIWSA